MNPDEATPASSLKTAAEAVELGATLLSFAAGALLLYRMAVPDGPEPLDILRDAWGELRGWARARRQYRAAMLETLEGIRDLPETEGES